MAESVVCGPVAELFPHMEWGSFASSWMLFESPRCSVPRPWMSGTLLLANTKVLLEEKDLMMAAHNPYAKEAQIHSKPNLFMTEVTLKDCVLGTAWVFVDSSSSSMDSLNIGNSLAKVRFMQFGENNLARIMVTHEMSDEYLYVSCMREMDARTASIWNGIIHRPTGICTIFSVSLNTKNCAECAALEKLCSCQGTALGHRFESEFQRRHRLAEVSQNVGHFGNKYIASWGQGMWSCHVQSQEPAMSYRLALNYMFEGQVFDTSLTSIVQNEVLSIQPPRASARFMALMQEQGSSEEVSDWTSLLCALKDEKKTAIKASQLKKEFEGDLSSLSLGSEIEREARKGTKNLQSVEQDLSSANKKAHKCALCEMKFRRRYDLTRHYRLVHEKRRDYACPQCSKKFSQQAHVNDHLKLVHERKKEHVCELCNMRFGLKYTRDRHIRNIH